MRKIIKELQLLCSSVALLSGLFVIFGPAPISALDCSGANKETVFCQSMLVANTDRQKRLACEGATAAGAENCNDASGSENRFGTIVRSVINVLSIVVGAVSVIMIIIGGFRYVISAGDSNATTGAKNTILYAVVGLVIVLFAQIIVRFVLTNASP